MSEQVNVILAPMAGRTMCTTKTVYQYNSGMLLKLIGLELPTGYEVDFANSATGSSITQVGNADGVRIPDQFFVPGSTIHAWYVAVGTDYAVTRYHIMIPIAQRASRTNEEPTQTQESALDEAIAALNDAIEHSPKIEDGDWYVWDASTGAWVNTGVQAEGQDGFSPVVGIGKIGNRITITFTDVNGEHSFTIHDGEDGVGIASIEKTATAGLVDTYTVTLTNGQTAEFTVTNGVNGEPGVSPTLAVSSITGGHRITITDKHGTQTVDVMDGENGDPGRGIVSVTKIDTSGLVDTYQITYTSGEPTTFTVTNGAPGTPGADGVSPAVSISTITGGHSVTITDKDHPTGQSFDVPDGTGGTTFTPSVAVNGDLSWSNDGGKTNPATVNIKGDPGPGVPAGGTDGQMLVKDGSTDYAMKWANVPSVPVQDVQINGTSILNNGVANIIQKRWELINEVTLTEDSTEIKINTDSNGQAFELINLIAFFSCGPSTTGARDSFYGQFLDNFLNNSVISSGGDSFPSLYYPSATSNMVAQIIMDTHYPGPITMQKIVAASTGQTATVESMAKNRISESITEIKIYQSAANKSLVPAGAKLTLWGVRK